MPQYQNATLNVASMPTGFSALMIYGQDEPMGGVERIFLAHGVKLRRSRNCLEARAIFGSPAPPSVVVTDLVLPDGNWADILRATNEGPAKTPVIVVSRILDTRLYLDVLDSGAHDFIVLPFSAPDLAYIVRTALLTGRPFAPGRRRWHGPVNRPRNYPTGRSVSTPSIDLISTNKERLK
jgi:DNA-binding NtrC family response regulator